MVVDVIAAIILLASVIISILRGFVREVLTILGIVGGSIAAYVGGPLLCPLVKNWMGIKPDAETVEKFFDVIPYPMLAEIISYAAVFVIFVIIFSVISHYLAEAVKSIGLGAVDRTLGMVFGVVRGVLFLGLLYLPIYYLVDDEQMEDWDWLKTSKSRVYLEATSGWIAGFIPAKSVENMTQATQELGSMNDARKKLQEMDLLRSDDNKTPENEILNKVPADKSSDNKGTSEGGYTDDFRSKMDQLIEETTQEQE